MKQGEIKPGVKQKNDRIRRAHAQQHITTDHNTSRNLDKSNNTKSTPCLYYYKGSCSLMGFDRGMTMLGRRDHRSYAQVVSHKCASTFSPITLDNHNTT